VRWRGSAKGSENGKLPQELPMLQGYLVLCRRGQGRIQSFVPVAGILAMQIPVDFHHPAQMMKRYCDNYIAALHCKNLGKCWFDCNFSVASSLGLGGQRNDFNQLRAAV